MPSLAQKANTSFSPGKDRARWLGRKTGSDIFDVAFFILVDVRDPLAVESQRYICFMSLARMNREPEGDWAAWAIRGLRGSLLKESPEREKDIGYSLLMNAVNTTVSL